jgi:hypothetical protein
MKDAVAMTVLTALSLWNHGTGSILALTIDRAYAHTFALLYGIRALRLCLRPRRRLVDIVVLTIYGFTVVFYAFELKEINIVLHMGIHGCTVAAFSLHMLTKPLSNATASSIKRIERPSENRIVCG